MPGLVKMGYEGQVKIGTAGSTASSLLENVKDWSQNNDQTRGNSTVRGDSSGPPVQTEETTIRIASIEFTMIQDTTDALYEDLCDAAADGTPVALRTLKHSTGKGFDGDVNVSVQDGRPLEGEATTQFTCTPCRGAGRMPVYNT